AGTDAGAASVAVFPETVLAMAQARIEAMDPDDRRLLRAASIFGPVFWVRGVMALLGHDASSASNVVTRLDDLVRREILVRRTESRFAGETEVLFRHALVREGAYAMLTERDAGLGHALAASWLEEAGETDPTTLAEHYERGGDRARAIRAYQRAAQQALEG